MTANVLVVDDSLTVRMDLKATLEQAGFAVTLCSTLGEARTALLRDRWNLLVLDVVLPDGDGVDLLGEVKRGELGPVLPVMLLTSEAVVRDRVRGWESGADDYVGKPYDRGYVIARARELAYSRAPGRVEGAPTTILVVEASPMYGAVLVSTLEEAGYAARLVTTGEEALRAAQTLRPAAAVLDARLPGIDGATVVRRMRLDAALRRMPTLLLTDTSDPGAELRALEAGVDAFVPQAADHGLLVARLAALLQASEHAAPPVAAQSLGPKRVLVVDPDPGFATYVSAALDGEGYDLAVATSGVGALELLAVQPVDCLLLELDLPDRPFAQVCREVRARVTEHDVAIVVVAARDDQGTLIHTIDAGADDFFPKSAPPEVLRARVRALLRRNQAAEERRRDQAQRMRQELRVAETRAAWDLAEARAALLADLREKNEELRRTNGLLAAARDQAERESSFKSRFLASMSHELRTPLNAIIGFSELLEQQLFGPLNERQLQYIGHVHSSGRHLLNLINDVLDLSKIAAGRLELHREWMDVSTIAEAVVSIVRPLAEKQGVHLETDVGRPLPLVHADAIRLRQVLYNLLSNAIKFTRAGGRVVLRAWELDDRLHLAVSDTGIGIRREDLSRLFTEFEQLDTDLGNKPEGTGLGLALTRRLVELHGGSVAVESEPGVGSTFTVSLPLHELASGEGGAQVLVVDDDPQAADLIAGNLRMAGVSSAWARTGEEALALAARLRPVAITLDILLPGVDTWDLLARLRADPATASIPVIVVSVVDEPLRAFGLGAADYLVKPIDRASLIAALQGVGVVVEPGLAVLLSGEDHPPVPQVAANLRALGHVVTRTAAPPPSLDGFDLVIADDAREGARPPSLAAASVPTLWLVPDERGGSPGTLPHAEALDVERLGRVVRAISRPPEPTSSPSIRLRSRRALLNHLRGALVRAERAHARVGIVAARMNGAAKAGIPSVQLEPGEMLGAPEPDLFVLIAEGVAASTDLEARASVLVQALTGDVPLDTALLWYPADAGDAETLWARLRERLAAGRCA